MATLAPTLNFWEVLSESKRIINAHSRHFLALSVIFLLPLSFSLIMYPTLQTTLSHSIPKHTQILVTHTHLHSTFASEHSLETLALPLIYTLFVLLISLCAVATITYSTYHGFYGRPVKLVATVKSLVYSILPLVATTIASQIAGALVCATFGLFLVLVTKGVEYLGFEIDYNSNYFLGFCVVLSVALVLVLVLLQVNWALAPVIAVVESKWGFEPLRRSTYLVKGMKTVSLSLLLFFGTVIGFSVWASARTSSGTSSSSFGDVWKCLFFILQTVAVSSLMTMFLLHNVATNTVLYMYCKALHGELAWEIAEEFAREYVSLPFDDTKVPHVVFVAAQT